MSAGTIHPEELRTGFLISFAAMSGLGDESLGAAAPFPSGSGAVPYFGLSWKPAVETLRRLTKSVSKNQLPVRDASSLSLVKISKGNPNRWCSSSCHCSTRFPGQTTRHLCRSPRAISSLIRSPAMIVLPAPGSSASKNLKGCRSIIDSYTAVI